MLIPRAVEIVRTLTGSIGLVAAVPLTTLLAAVVITKGTAGPGEVADPERRAYCRWRGAQPASFTERRALKRLAEA